MNNRPEVKMRVFQSCNMADRLRRLRTLNVANVLKDNSAVECEGINIEWTNKLKSTEW